MCAFVFLINKLNPKSVVTSFCALCDGSIDKDFKKTHLNVCVCVCNAYGMHRVCFPNIFYVSSSFVWWKDPKMSWNVTNRLSTFEGYRSFALTTSISMQMNIDVCVRVITWLRPYCFIDFNFFELLAINWPSGV